jgi:hypothetical protein
MSRSERAAGLIPFIIMLVLFLAAVGVWYLYYTKAEKLEGDLGEAEAKYLVEKVQKEMYTQQLREFVEVIGFPGSGTMEKPLVEGDPDSPKTQAQLLVDVAGARDHIQNWMTQWEQIRVEFDAWSLEYSDDNIKKRPDGKFFVRYFEMGDKRPNDIRYAEAFPLVDAAFKRFLSTTRTFKTLVVDYESALTEAQKKEGQVSQDLTARLDQERTNAQQRIETLQRSLSDLRDTKDRLDVRVQDLTDEKDKIAEDADSAKKDAANQILALEQQLKRLKEQIEIDRVPTPDGQVLAASAQTGIAVINRGKADHLKPGTVFQTYNFAKGGVKRAKGVLKVIDVFDSQAKCAILQMNPNDPIVEGDFIINDLYNPGKSLHFFILGKLSKYGKTEATAVLERLGNKVDEKLGVLTDYVILGQKENPDDPNLEETEIYKNAKQLGVKIITEKQLEAFTKY